MIITLDPPLVHVSLSTMIEYTNRKITICSLLSEAIMAAYHVYYAQYLSFIHYIFLHN